MKVRVSFAALLAAFVLWTEPLGANDTSRYVGAAKCGSCHEAEYQKWLAGPHAKAHKSLTSEQLADSKCNTCHTLVPFNTDKRFLGVQCEQCHGGGKVYHKEYVMRDKELARAVGLVVPKAADCQTCHTADSPNIKPFNYDELWMRIAHGASAAAHGKSASIKP
ncbi:MAG: hypothetical protein CMH60_01970 [Myxococcales bacterium]|nr:hypothetical protein [Myxococcales bacterium]